MSEHAKSTLADWEREEIARANESDLTPVVFVHGLWLLLEQLAAAGATSSRTMGSSRSRPAGLTTPPRWPRHGNKPGVREEGCRCRQVTDHYLEAIAEARPGARR